MPDLIAKSALEGWAPLTLGTVTLAEIPVGRITSVAVFPGGAKAVAKALKPLGLAFPAPNTWAAKGEAQLVWTGRDQAFLIGVEPPEMPGAALTDQSDGWVVLSVSGAGSVDVLARLVPLDLRLGAFPVGCAVRAPLGHMNAVVVRTGADAFGLMLFRSMARTAWHEIEAAMQQMAARGGLKP